MFTYEKVIFKHMLLGNGPEKVIAVYNFWNNKLEYDPLFPYLDQESFTYVFADVRGYADSVEIPGEYPCFEPWLHNY